MDWLTIGDFYRQRYGKCIEVFCSSAIIVSYLGWVAAQIKALNPAALVLYYQQASAAIPFYRAATGFTSNPEWRASCPGSALPLRGARASVESLVRRHCAPAEIETVVEALRDLAEWRGCGCGGGG